MDIDEAVRLRRAVNRLARALNAAATDEGLTPTQASVLGLIIGRGPVSPRALAELEHINPTMLSRVVGVLADSDLVARTPDPNDLRSSSIQATGTGRAMHKRITAQRAAAMSRAVAGLTPGEHDALVIALPALEKLADHLQ